MEYSHHNKFINGLRWGALESVGYEAMLLLHQLALCKAIGIATYGAAGAIIAAIYLLARLLNFGFDLSTGPFFKLAAHNKNNFKKILLYQLALQVVIYIMIPVILFLFIPQASSKIAHYLKQDIDYLLVLIAFLGMIAEGMQRVVKSILYLTFDNKKIAVTEICKISIYILLVWVLYFAGYELNSISLILPLLICSLFPLISFSISLKKFYDALPDQSEHIVPHNIMPRIVRSRIFTSAHQIVAQLYSSNFLIPMIALFFNNKQAGILTLASSVSYFIAEIIRKTFGNSSSALFSHIKHSELENKQQAFGKVTGLLYCILIMIGCIIFISYKKCSSFFVSEYSPQDWIPTYIFLLIHFSEHFMIPYKKFFIVEENAHKTILFDAFDFILIFLTLQLWWICEPHHVLIGIISARCIALCSLASYAYYQWKIYPDFTLIPYHYYLYPTAAYLSLTYFINFLSS